ncbi:MAG: hypothetical protein GC191_08840 [Azospirillum sp.]|nr:hypothetical protein [Azospirillum sp.]
MRVKCKFEMDGPGPAEAVVSIQTADGHGEEVIVYKPSILHNMIEVGSTLQSDPAAKRALIELPRESVTGQWRIWVPLSALA